MDGASNMAADDVLLAAAASPPALLRFYRWSEPTLTLGYFQSAKLIGTSDLPTTLPWLRRPTGGGALVHDHELTYALAVPAETALRLSKRASAWLSCLHEIIRHALADLKVSTEAMTTDLPPSGALCFHQLTRDDLLAGRMKVVGSAQRRQRGALLQHGAILLAQSPHARSLPGIKELCGVTLSETDLAERIGHRLQERLKWNLQASAWTSAERRNIEELAANKYHSPAWNAKR